MAREKFTIEKAYEELEGIIAKLESEEITLEDSLNYYKKGVKLLEKCQTVLDTVEKEMIILKETGEE
ncbi:MAG: exodeoxyribonuclease VII small subunit [Lachnospiraceae bacterium]